MKKVKEIGILILTAVTIVLIIAFRWRDISEPVQSTDATTETEVVTKTEDTRELSEIPVRELGKRQKLQISDSAEIYPAGDVCKIWNGTSFRFDVEYADHLWDPYQGLHEIGYKIRDAEKVLNMMEIDCYVYDSTGHYHLYGEIEDRSDCSQTDVLYMVMPKGLAELEK